MNKAVSQYLRRIGRKGGLKSRRTLSPDAARSMVQVREARRAFMLFRVTCFWSVDPTLRIGPKEVPWVIESLKKHGDRTAWITAHRLESLGNAGHKRLEGKSLASVTDM